MAWELNGENNVTNRRGIVGGFTWSRRNDGDCLAFECEARGDMLGIPPRGLVDFRVNGVRQFYGIAVEIPNPLSGAFGRLRAVGAAELLGRTLTDSRHYRDADIGAIARDLLTRLRHPLITGVRCPDMGARLKDFYMPYQPLSAALEALAKAAPTGSGQGVTFGVDAEGVAYWGVPAPGGALGAALPSDAPVIVGDVVSRAVIVFNFRRQGGEPVIAMEVADPAGSKPGTPRIPTVYTVAAEREHATYWSERAFLPPQGVKSYKASAAGLAVARSEGLWNAGAVIDGTPGTYAASTGEPQSPDAATGYAELSLAPLPGGAPVIGFRLSYTLRPPQNTADPKAYYPPHKVAVLLGFNHNLGFFGAEYSFPGAIYVWEFGETRTTDTPEERVVIYPPELWLSSAAPTLYMRAAFEEHIDRAPLVKNAQGVESRAAPTIHPDTLKIYALEPIYANVEELTPLAEANLSLPGDAPKTIKVNGLVPPSMAGSAFDYVHNEEVLSQTTISIGQRGGATGLGQAVKSLADKAAEPTRQDVLGQVIQG